MPSQRTGPRPAPDTRRAIVDLLKQEGPQDAAALAGRLSVSAMAVRQHLYALRDEGLVDFTEEARPLGRPAKLWRLTAAADRLFPDGYARLALDLIGSMKEAFGEEGLDRLLEARTRAQAEALRSRIPRTASLGQKLQALAEARTAEGYMAETRRQEDGTWLLVENHCPICAAARACQGLCQRELELFQSVLGKGVTVERTDHIVAGARRCAYLIRLLRRP
jgi:predicted ArsR family transcriptional regulator